MMWSNQLYKYKPVQSAQVTKVYWMLDGIWEGEQEECMKEMVDEEEEDKK